MDFALLDIDMPGMDGIHLAQALRRELLLPLYHQFNDWILEYNLEKIDRLFAPAKE